VYTGLIDETQTRKKVYTSSSKKRLLEGASTCNLTFEHGVLKKKKVKFNTTTHHWLHTFITLYFITFSHLLYNKPVKFFVLNV